MRWRSRAGAAHDGVVRLTLDDTTLHYDDTGPASSGETIVFSHGLLWSGAMFAAQVEALRDRYRCISYDHRGQGRSDDVECRNIDLGTVTADAITVVERVARAPVHFVGLSMGGFVGMRIAARRPQLLRSLTLIETSADPEPDANVLRYRALNLVAQTLGVKVVASQVMPIMFGKTFLTDPARAAEREAWRARLASNRRSIYRAVNGVIERESVFPELGRIVAPTLVMVGEEDVATVPAKAERIARAIAGAELVRIPHAGHSSAIEAPARVSQALEHFLERAAPRVASR